MRRLLAVVVDTGLLLVLAGAVLVLLLSSCVDECGGGDGTGCGPKAAQGAS
jgi:hypothetical protein